MSDDTPPCPSCETDVLVTGFAGPADWLCYSCSRTFDSTAEFKGKRGWP
jgi:tRNA(Ile2) C34 agmatinyltransferase TiaS